MDLNYNQALADLQERRMVHHDYWLDAETRAHVFSLSPIPQRARPTKNGKFRRVQNLFKAGKLCGEIVERRYIIPPSTQPFGVSLVIYNAL